MLSSEHWLEDHDPIELGRARAELRRHQCRVIEWEDHDEHGEVVIDRILVTNDIDEADWIACTPAAILGWLGY